MKVYKFKASASNYHILLHKGTLIAAINYDKKRGIDCKELENELSQLNKFYGLV